MIVQGFDVYKTYLAFKQHFSNPKFDFFQYDGKVRAKEETYHDRKDFYFFETLARKHTDQEIKEYLLASFVSSDDPSKVWIGDIKRDGKAHWMVWTKLHESLTYAFVKDLNTVAQHMETSSSSLNDILKTMGGSPPLLKLYIQRRINLESLIIFDMVLGFSKHWDKQMFDPLWEQLSFKIKKYKPFLNIPTDKYRTLMKEKFL